MSYEVSLQSPLTSPSTRVALQGSHRGGAPPPPSVPSPSPPSLACARLLRFRCAEATSAARRLGGPICCRDRLRVRRAAVLSAA